MLNNLLQMHLKLLQKESNSKNAEATGDLIGNKTADKITRVAKTSPHNNSETNEEQTIRERYTSSQYRRKMNHLNLEQEIGL